MRLYDFDGDFVECEPYDADGYWLSYRVTSRSSDSPMPIVNTGTITVTAAEMRGLFAMVCEYTSIPWYATRPIDAPSVLRTAFSMMGEMSVADFINLSGTTPDCFIDALVLVVDSMLDGTLKPE